MGQESAIPVSTLGVERLEDMNCPRHSYALFWANDELLVVGGHTTGFVPLQSAEYYRDGHWHLVETLYPHDGAFHLNYSDGRILVGGGFSDSFGVGRTFGMEWYYPEEHRFAPAGIMSRKRAISSAIELPDGNILVCGNWMDEDDIEVLNPEAKVLYTKGVSVARVAPFLFKTADGDVRIIGERADDTGWEASMDSLLGEPADSAFPEGWYPLHDFRPYDDRNHSIAPCTYLLPAMSSENGRTALMIFENGRFSLLETDYPIPDVTAAGDSLIWHYEGLLTDRSARCAYVPAGLPDGRFCFLKIDYNPAFDGGKAVLSMSISSEPLPVRFSEMPTVLLPGSRIAVVGGIPGDNFEPHASAFIFHLDDDAQAASRPFPWVWLVLALCGMGLGLLAGARLQKRNQPAATPQPLSPEQIADLLMKQVISKMEDERLYLRKGLTISDLASELNTNKTYISFLLNQRQGKSFSAFVNGYRIDYAKRLMQENPDMKISEVADSSGFTEESSFFRNFKQTTGLTPSAWKAGKYV